VGKGEFGRMGGGGREWLGGWEYYVDGCWKETGSVGGRGVLEGVVSG